MPQKQHNWQPLFPQAQVGGIEAPAPDLNQAPSVPPPSAPASLGTNIKVKRGTDASPVGASPFSTILTEAGAPFSARDSGGNWQMPPIIGGMLDIMRKNFPLNPADMKKSDIGANASALYHGFADPVNQMATGDPNARAEGFGKIISQLIPMFLTSEALQSDVVKNAPTPPPEAAPMRPTAAAEPPAIDVPYKPIPKTAKGLPEGPMAPKALPAGSNVGERAFQGKEGGIPPRGEQTVTPTQVPHLSVRDATTGKFRKMTNAEVKAFTDRLVSERSDFGKTQAPKPPTRSTPKPKGKQ